MPFTDIELKYIENTVGKMCKRRSPVHLHNQLRTVYEVRGLDVVVHEERRYNQILLMERTKAYPN